MWRLKPQGRISRGFSKKSKKKISKYSCFALFPMSFCRLQKQLTNQSCTGRIRNAGVILLPQLAFCTATRMKNSQKMATSRDETDTAVQVVTAPKQ